MGARRRQLDAEMVRRGLAVSRPAARRLIEAGSVLVAGSPATKVARMVHPGDALVLRGDAARFVGRGGEKLAAALEVFALDPGGLRILDAGASTGGFTDCLLQAGAAEVVALDVGHGQIHERLRSDARVVVLERTNLRHVSVEDLGWFDAAVADLSFISLTQVMEVLVGLVRSGGWLVVLVKPQFECSHAEVSRGRGVVRSPEAWAEALAKVTDSARSHGATIIDVMASPIRGGDGNVEFLVHLGAVPPAVRPDGSPSSQDVRTLIDDAIASVHREPGPAAPADDRQGSS